MLIYINYELYKRVELFESRISKEISILELNQPLHKSEIFRKNIL